MTYAGHATAGNGKTVGRIWVIDLEVDAPLRERILSREVWAAAFNALTLPATPKSDGNPVHIDVHAWLDPALNVWGKREESQWPEPDRALRFRFALHT